MSARTRIALAAAVAALSLTVVAATSLAASAAPPKKGTVVPDQYIVVFKPAKVDAPAKLAQRLTDEHGGRLKHTYRHALEGYSARLSDQAVKQLRSDPAVKSIEPDRIGQLTDIQTAVGWGLDRIDQRSVSLVGKRSYNDYNEGKDVHAYVIDTGIKPSHSEFAGRLGKGYDAVTAGGNADDCNGHGTHVAGILGGETVGVADKVVLHPVRVAECNASLYLSRFLWGIDWVTANKVKPAVANISLRFVPPSSAVETAVTNLIKAGVTVAVAAGNDSVDACTLSPARVPAAITVGATSESDARSWFSNYGPCLDLFAPGDSIKSAALGDPPFDNFTWDSGTSLASPFVAGVAALYLSAYPSATPADVYRAIVSGATKDIVTDPSAATPNNLLAASPNKLLAASPNRLLYNNVAEMPTPRPPRCELTRTC
jgi:subtilisin family serine protease